MIKQVNADQVAEKLQRNLYVAVDDLDVEKMTGKWYTVSLKHKSYGRKVTSKIKIKNKSFTMYNQNAQLIKSQKAKK